LFWVGALVTRPAAIEDQLPRTLRDDRPLASDEEGD
jgi:hypothetical protein